MPYIIWYICLYDIYWPRRKHFTLPVCRVVTHSRRSEAFFVKRKCTGGTISGSARCGTEFMPGNSSQMISLHKCVKCPLKSAHNRLVYIFPWMKASFLRTTPEEDYKPHIYPSTWFKRRRRSQRDDWECFMLYELKHLPGFLFKSNSYLAKFLLGCSGLFTFVWFEFVVFSFEKVEEEQQKTIEMAKLR